MKGFRAKAWAAGCMAASLVSAVGCGDYTYDDIVDPCWPQRYACVARHEVNTPLATQADNGAVLEQTVWDYHFGADKDGNVVLTRAGIEKLNSLARRRPTPMPEIFVQTAQNVEYNAATPEQFATKRQEVDGKRVKAVTDYLAAARPDVPFKVAVHDPQRVGLNGIEVNRAVGNMHYSSVGNIPYDSFGNGRPYHGNSREQFGPAGQQGPSGLTGPAAGPGGVSNASARQADEAYNINRTAVESIDQTIRQGGGGTPTSTTPGAPAGSAPAAPPAPGVQ